MKNKSPFASFGLIAEFSQNWQYISVFRVEELTVPAPTHYMGGRTARRYGMVCTYVPSDRGMQLMAGPG